MRRSGRRTDADLSVYESVGNRHQADRLGVLRGLRDAVAGAATEEEGTTVTLAQKAEDLNVRKQFELLEMAWPGPVTSENIREFAMYLRRQADRLESINLTAQGIR
jgi:hypothetical protein